MSSSAAVVLLVCVVMCLGRRGFEYIKDEKQLGEENRVFSQVLEELRRLTEADNKKTDEINYIKDADKKKTDEINNLKDADKKKTEEINHLKDLINHLTDEDKKNKDAINNLKGQITSSKAAVHDSSAFMVVMDGGYQYPDIGDVILFDHILLNVGQHYNDTTSIFTCAEGGLYQFSVTLYSSTIGTGAYDRVSGALMVDGEIVAEIKSLAYDPDHNQAHQSAVTAVVECPQGGSVWVECQESNSQVYGEDFQPNSIFTGYAITYNNHP